ncbi:membrane-associated protease RseP (regulator of RpoE activity) [Allocatelliglobosispora scoriae]|uniref:Membrane-associated protease RseP (Regulator of RpoE activity) n=1 Tax=Allocatelliglobosispora scoriae TaxID=643052 RepID=A0A841BXN7_9ACTN|nr:site-2 protease family protein [Allocatelliglobosispora scoriae]MBB5872258.1 membrane-associated protease RseP (regulator of RpoE activity) [Allocatelliglobosispora scoriae]
MIYALGLVALALALFVSVCLHEAGHMGTAKMFGMRVTRYFAGFGPTLWSFKRGETEYGIKGIPLGGFVKIVGMTPQEDDADDPRAMWRYPVWKRTIVMSAGSVVHFILAFFIFWGVAATASLPNSAIDTPAEQLAQPAIVTVAECIPMVPEKGCQDTDPKGAALTAGLKDGDQITRVGSTDTPTYLALVGAIRTLPAEQKVDITFLRDGVSQTVSVQPTVVERTPIDDPDGKKTKVAAIGVGQDFLPALKEPVHYNVVEAFPVAADYYGRTISGSFAAMKKIPEKVPALFGAISGDERDPNGPISVVGASRIGGELAEVGAWAQIFLVIASLNLFFGIFNLLPLLPLDGGHIAIAWFERARTWVYARFGKADPGRVDYYKLMPVTYAVIFIFGAFTLLTVTADVVNPIRIFR